MNNYIGLFFSFLIIVVLLFIASILKKYNIVSIEGSRKVIHIGIGYWWIIAMIYFDSVYIAIIPPLIYIVLNYFSYKFNIVTLIENRDKDNLGTIYYPISLLILVIFSFGIIERPYIGAVGALIMANGDGLAAMVGKHVKTRKLYQYKTLGGSLTMLFISFIVTLIISLMFYTDNLIVNIIIVPICATLLELFSLKGTDNLTVPIITSLIYYIITIL